jgi:Fe-S-cluster-containing dehydrogenase component
MAEFVQTMKDWRRMCKHYTDESMKDGLHSCVDMCPLGNNTACGMIEDARDSDIEVMAKEVAKWAAEHPEPVYPTWGEWLQRLYDNTNYAGIFITPIPADIAEKLGLQPKEG